MIKILKKVIKFIYAYFPVIDYESIFTLNLKDFNCQNLDENIHLITLDNLKLLKKGFPNLNLDIYRALLLRGDYGFTYSINEHFISYHWVQTTGLHFIQSVNKHVPIKTKDAWLYNVKVHQNYRGRGINSKVMNQICYLLKQKEVEKLLVYTKGKNISQRKSLKKFGFVEKNKLKFLKIKNLFIEI